MTENILKKQLAEYEEKSKNSKKDIELSMVDYIKMNKSNKVRKMRNIFKF